MKGRNTSSNMLNSILYSFQAFPGLAWEFLRNQGKKKKKMADFWEMLREILAVNLTKFKNGWQSQVYSDLQQHIRWLWFQSTHKDIQHNNTRERETWKKKYSHVKKNTTHT